MKKLIFALLACYLSLHMMAQEIMEVHYMDRAPFLYTDDQGNLTGLEHDIILAFKGWFEHREQKQLILDFIPHTDFEAFLLAVKNGNKNTMGAGTVTYTNSRAQDFKFAGPYLKNTSLLVSYPGKPFASTDFLTTAEATLLVTKQSVHEKHMKQFQSQNNQLVLKTVASQTEIPALLRQNKDAYGWMDLVFYWHQVQQHPENALQLHRNLMKQDEAFHFIAPKKTNWFKYMYYFFNDGFGFTQTKQYHQIVGAYLGEEVVPYTEMNP
jgi:hypothetical protein